MTQAHRDGIVAGTGAFISCVIVAILLYAIYSGVYAMGWYDGCRATAAHISQCV